MCFDCIFVLDKCYKENQSVVKLCESPTTKRPNEVDFTPLSSSNFFIAAVN